MWIEIASCLAPELKERFIHALFTVDHGVKSFRHVTKKQDLTTYYSRGIPLMATFTLTEFDYEAAQRLSATANHRIIKGAIYEHVGRHLDIEAFTTTARGILTTPRTEKLRELESVLFIKECEIPADQFNEDVVFTPNFSSCLYELAELQEAILSELPTIEPTLSPRVVAQMGAVSTQLVESVLSDPKFATWIATPRIRFDMLYEEALLRGIQRLRNEVLEAPIRDFYSGAFDTKNAQLVLATVKFLDERTRASQVHLHQHLEAHHTSLPRHGPKSIATTLPTAVTHLHPGPRALPSASDIDSMDLAELTRLEAEIDGKE